MERGYPGGGGKIRKGHRGKAAAKPYERPATGRHAPAEVRYQGSENVSGGGGGGGWLFKFVDPAKKLFSAFFQRQARQEEVDEDDNDPELSFVNLEDTSIHEEIYEDAVNETTTSTPNQVTGNNLVGSNQNSKLDVLKLESFFKDKTLSREEFNRLSGLLQSKVSDNFAQPEGNEERDKTVLSLENYVLPNTADASRLNEQRQNVDTDVCMLPRTESPTNLDLSAQVFKNSFSFNNDVGASPADIAKAYMGERVHGRSPFTVRTSPVCLDMPSEKSKSLILTTKQSHCNDGQAKEIYKTPQSQRMLAGFQNFNRTPYNYPLQKQGNNLNRTPYNYPLQKQGNNFSGAGPSSSRWTPLSSPVTSGKQTLKRRISVMDGIVESGGNVRRIRQKSNLFSTESRNTDYSNSILSLRQSNLFSAPQYSNREHQQLVNLKTSTAQSKDDNQVLDSISTHDFLSCSGVPPQSSKIARKILEQLDRITPSPKDKSADALVTGTRDKSPTPTLNMLNGKAGSNIELFENSSSGKNAIGYIQKNSRSKSVDTSSQNGSPVLSFGLHSNVDLKFPVSLASLEKGLGFQEHEKGVLPQTDTLAEKPSIQANSAAVASKSSASQSSSRDSSFVFPVTAVSDTLELSHITTKYKPLISEGSNQVVSQNDIPKFSFGSGVRNGPVFSFSTNANAEVDASTPKFDFKFESKPDSSFSIAVEAATTAKTSNLPSHSQFGSSLGTSAVIPAKDSKNVSCMPFSFVSSVDKTSIPLDKNAKQSAVKETIFPTVMDSAAVPNESGLVIGLTKLSSSLDSSRSQANPTSPTNFASGAAAFGLNNSSTANLGLQAQSTCTTPSFVFDASKTSSQNGSSSTCLGLNNSLQTGSNVSFGLRSSQATSTAPFSFVSNSAQKTTSAPFSFGHSAVPNSNGNSLSSTSGGTLSNTGSGTTSVFAFGSSSSGGTGSAVSSMPGSLTCSSSLASSSSSSGTHTLFCSGTGSAFGDDNTVSMGSCLPFGSSSNSSSAAGSSFTFNTGKNNVSSSTLNPSLGGRSGSSASAGSSLFSFGGSNVELNSSNTPSFGVSNSPTFGIGSNSAPSFGVSNSPTFGIGSSVSFKKDTNAAPPSGNGSATTTFGTMSSTQSFGVSSGNSPIFGTDSTSATTFASNGSFVFGASSATQTSNAASPTIGSASGSLQSSTPFSFGGSGAVSNPVIFASSGNTSSVNTSAFGAPSANSSLFTTPASAATSSIFGLSGFPSSGLAQPSSPQADQMEDSMAEDTNACVTQAATPSLGIQTQTGTQPASFAFGAQAPATETAAYQFGAQLNPPASNPFAGNTQNNAFSPGASGGFSLGASGGGGDKSGRKFIKVNRNKTRRK